jgi:hypothetical protein
MPSPRLGKSHTDRKADSMNTRRGDYRDLLGAYGLALDAKKLIVAFAAVLLTGLILFLGTCIDDRLMEVDWTPTPIAVEAGDVGGEWSVWIADQVGQLPPGASHNLCARVGSVLNPFHGGIAHLVLSVAILCLLLGIWSYHGGIISRLAVLEYARDDLPTLSEAESSVRARKPSYFLAPVTPVLLVLCLAVMGGVIGLVASIPYVGPILLLVPGLPVAMILALLILFLTIVGLMAFGMMMPAVSADGKGAFETWTTTYSYVLWGFSRFLVYSLLAGAVGIVAVIAACALAQLLVYLVVQLISLGFIGSIPWMIQAGGAGAGSAYTAFFQAIVSIILLLMLVLPVAYAASYFFSANSIIFLLMRKHIDNVDVDVVCEDVVEAPVAQAVEAEAAPAPEADVTPPEPDDEAAEITDEDVTSAAEQAMAEEVEPPDDAPEPSKEPAEEPDEAAPDTESDTTP